MISAPSLEQSKTRRQAFVRLLWVGTLLVNLFVIGMVSFVIVKNRERAVDQASVLTDNYSKVLEENIAGFISKIDITLLTVIEEISRQKAHGGINTKAFEEFIKLQDSHMPEALGLRVVDAQGIIRFAVNDVKVRNASIADRPQFIRLRDEPNAGLVFSKPVMGRTAQKWIITLSRRITNPDGSFAGDVHAAVAVDHFIEMFSRINLGLNGNIGLWDKTNLIARYSNDDANGATVGANTPSTMLRSLLDSDQTVAPYHARSGVDGIERSYFFRKVNNYPLYLVVGLADQDYLSEWRRDSLDIAGLASLFALVTVGSSILIYRGWKRREKDRENLLHQEAKYNSKLVTSHLEAESARQKSQLILSSVGEGICGVDLEGKILFVNPAARKMYGWGEEENIGLDLHSLVHHHRANGRPFPHSECALFKTLLDGEQRQVKEDIYWRKDGSPFPVEFTVMPMKQDGNISGAVSVFRDVTERKKMEEALKDSELRYRTVADFTSDWEYWIMEDNSFRFVSPSSEQISGYTPEEFYADPQLLVRIIFPDDLHLYAGHVHQTNAQGFAEPIDFRIITKSGETRWISHVCRSVYDSAGQHIGQRASNRDITNRKAAEEQIRNLAFYDTLTKLPNRRLLNDRMEQTMAASKRSARYAALMFLDLDNFKPLNDSHGHGVGDLLLIEVARRLTDCVREVDTVARFGGDEFVVMLSELEVDKAESSAQASIVAEKIRANLAEPYLLKIQQAGNAEITIEHRCTSSIGVVLFTNHEASQEEVFKWADMAMYQAKMDGRNLIRFFDPKTGRCG